MTQLKILSFNSFFYHFLFREKALKAFQKEKQKQRDLDEVAREKVRDTIRQKYGIENKPRDTVTKSPKSEERSIQVIVELCKNKL